MLDGTKILPELISSLLAGGHSVKFRAPGGSMYPTICDGDVITVVPIESASVAVGDIILYRHTSGVAAHRVIHLTKRDPADPQFSDPAPEMYHILRGDAAVVFDEPVDTGQILGKVTLVERKGRLSNPYSLKTIVCYKARRLIACLKRFIFIRA